MIKEKTKSLNEMSNEELIAFIDRRNRNNFILKSVFLVLLISGSIFASSLLNTKFGIGEVAPVAKLEVKGDGTTSATINTNLKNNANTSLFYVRDDGNIGVGTTVPSAKLHVNGNVNVANGTLSSHAVNLGQFANLKNNNGYTKLPNGLILQWGIETIGYHDIGPDVNITMNFPIPFPTTVLYTSASIHDSVAGNLDMTIASRIINNSQIDIRAEEWGAAFQSIKVGYFAIGY